MARTRDDLPGIQEYLVTKYPDQVEKIQFLVREAFYAIPSTVVFAHGDHLLLKMVRAAGVDYLLHKTVDHLVGCSEEAREGQLEARSTFERFTKAFTSIGKIGGSSILSLTFIGLQFFSSNYPACMNNDNEDQCVADANKVSAIVGITSATAVAFIMTLVRQMQLENQREQQHSPSSNLDSPISVVIDDVQNGLV